MKAAFMSGLRPRQPSRMRTIAIRGRGTSTSLTDKTVMPQVHKFRKRLSAERESTLREFAAEMVSQS
jgi:hypothetical protein